MAGPGKLARGPLEEEGMFGVGAFGGLGPEKGYMGNVGEGMPPQEAIWNAQQVAGQMGGAPPAPSGPDASGLIGRGSPSHEQVAQGAIQSAQQGAAPPPDKGIGLQGWLGIGSAVGQLGSFIFNAVKKQPKQQKRVGSGVVGAFR